MPNKEILSKEEIDYLQEMMNIGAGNAITALSQLLECDVDVKVPHVYILTPKEAVSIMGDPSLPVACVKMSMVGDVTGEVFFLIPEKEKESLIHMVEKSVFGFKRKGPIDLSVLEEVGNIMAGVYLTAIHDFCRLNIFHTVPILKTDMLQSILDELLISMGRYEERFIVIEHEIAIITKEVTASPERYIKAFMFLILIPSMKSVGALLDSIKGAMPR